MARKALAAAPRCEALEGLVMPMCFDCKNCAPLDKLPASKLDSGQ